MHFNILLRGVGGYSRLYLQFGSILPEFGLSECWHNAERFARSKFLESRELSPSLSKQDQASTWAAPRPSDFDATSLAPAIQGLDGVLSSAPLTRSADCFPDSPVALAQMVLASSHPRNLHPARRILRQPNAGFVSPKPLTACGVTSILPPTGRRSAHRRPHGVSRCHPTHSIERIVHAIPAASASCRQAAPYAPPFASSLNPTRSHLHRVVARLSARARPEHSPSIDDDEPSLFRTPPRSASDSLSMPAISYEHPSRIPFRCLRSCGALVSAPARLGTKGAHKTTQTSSYGPSSLCGRRPSHPMPAPAADAAARTHGCDHHTSELPAVMMSSGLNLSTRERFLRLLSAVYSRSAAPHLPSSAARSYSRQRILSLPLSAPLDTQRFDWEDRATYILPFVAAQDIVSVHLIIPAHIPSEHVCEFIDLPLSKGVKRFVLMSGSLYPIQGLMRAHLLQDSGIPFCIFRPSRFFEKNSQIRESIRDDDKIVTAAGTASIGFVACQDVARVAVEEDIDGFCLIFEWAFLSIPLTDLSRTRQMFGAPSRNRHQPFDIGYLFGTPSIHGTPFWTGATMRETTVPLQTTSHLVPVDWIV
ncbi:hypothetical protein DFH09DRAFT_1086992 [Mycena vulgaris]|nr:hypothetical protein DFH09DRAFT_1086992 [Mycena vulgaris]